MLTYFLPPFLFEMGSRWQAYKRTAFEGAVKMCVFFRTDYTPPPPPFFFKSAKALFQSLKKKRRSNNWRWKYWILACRLKAVEVLIWLWMLGGNVKWNLREFMVVKRMHRERSQLCHLKKDFNKWLALSPVRYSSCVWLTGWCWSSGGEQRERVMEHIPNTLPEKEYPS